MGVHESFEPCTSVIILDLNDVSKDNGVIWFDEKFQFGGMFVECPIESFLCRCNGIRNRYTGGRGCDALCSGKFQTLGSSAHRYEIY